MNIIVFGASGRTGRQIVEQALKAGHEVTAFVRDPAKLALSHQKLRIVKGDVFDAKAVANAIAGHDAVLSGLGPVRGGPKDVMMVAARNIVAGMKASFVRRLVTVTGAGVAQPGDQPKLFNRFMSLMLNTFARNVLLDSAEHARIVRQSDLDWTIVRVPVLTDGPATGRYRVGMVGLDDGARIARADVAEFMLRQLEPGAKPHIAPVVSA